MNENFEPNSSNDQIVGSAIAGESVDHSWKSFSLGFLDLSVQTEAGCSIADETGTLPIQDQKNEPFGYLLKEPLAKGGQGTVWLAWQTNLDREVALKIHESQNSDTFLHEAFTTASLEHPNIVPIYDIGYVNSPDGSTKAKGNIPYTSYQFQTDFGIPPS